MQQHPSAKAEDVGEQLTDLSNWMQEHGKDARAPKFIPSPWKSDDIQVVTDVALYHQTSMAPQLVLAGIRTIQVDYEKSEDFLVVNHLCPSVTTALEFMDALAHANQSVQTEEQYKLITESLGIKEDWLKILESALRHRF
jgi:formylmethanofuran dehydrogenase subunit E-like metal-binding protein